MRNLYVVLVLMIWLSGCNIFEADSAESVVRDFDVVNAEIESAGEYIYNVGPLGDEEQVSIKEDRPNASVSELFYDFDGTAVVKYRYRPETGFSGKDTIVLEVRRGSDGETKNTDIYYMVINLNIRE
ncbi:MAG: hypothetical protein U5K72_15455 [Balneolaceae bacterium]|nr:hypothetical protein [Balneolaceae bacterium]